MNPPGFSVLKGGTPAEAAGQIKAAFPAAQQLHEAAKVVGSATEEAIRAAGFDIIPVPTKRLPNHHRVIHPDGAAGFTEVNLAKLSDAFADTQVED